MEDPIVPNAEVVVPPPADDSALSANLDSFLDYLKKTAQVVLGPGPSGTIRNHIFEDKASVDAAKRFITDTQTRVILLQKVYRKGNVCSPRGLLIRFRCVSGLLTFLLTHRRSR